MKHDEESLGRIYRGVALMTEGGVFDEEDLAKLVAKQYAENRVLAILNAELERVEGEIGIQKKVYKKSGEIVAVGRKKVAVATTLRSELMGKIEALQDHADYIKSQIKAVEEL